MHGSVLVVGVGASRGLGAAIARRFAAGGFPVAIAGRNAPKLEVSAAELKAAGATVASIVGDASSPDDARRFVAAAQELAPLALAVHNAGGNRPAPFLKVDPAVFEGHWREHVLGGFHLAQAALPALIERGGGGSLFFTGASGSLRGKANFAPFAAAKAALRAMAQSIAREFGPQGVHVGHVVVDGGIEGERLLTFRPATEGRARPRRHARHRRHRRRLLGPASPAPQRLDPGTRPPPVVGELLRDQPQMRPWRRP